MKYLTVKSFILCLILTSSFLVAEAQVISCYFTNDYVVDPGSTFTAEIRVDSFINIGGGGISIKWDPAVLQFKEAGNIGLELSDLSGFNDSKAVSDGELGFLWLSKSSTVGDMLPDSSIFFTITFDAIGTTGDTTSLRFTDVPLRLEFLTISGTLIPVNPPGNALVTIGSTSNTSFNSAPSEISIQPPAPNPFYEDTFINVDLQRATQTTIQIVDLQGKLLYEKQQLLGAGEQTIPISKAIFETPGTYLCLLTSKEFRVSQKLVFIGR